MALLACDMDGTVIPLENSARQQQAIEEFSCLVAKKQFRLAYITGRHFSHALSGIKEFQLPEPEFLCCDVGTSIYKKSEGEWRIDQSYREQLSLAWASEQSGVISQLICSQASFREQEAEKQAEFKRSFYFSTEAVGSNIEQEVLEILNEKSIVCSVIVSRDPLTGDGLLDVLPAKVAKDTALGFLVDEIDEQHSEVVYAGDSGNDLSVFLKDYRSIVVANAPKEVKDAVKVKQSEGSLFIASEKYMRGVLEGCRWHGLS